jgi:hypothetical protein
MSKTTQRRTLGTVTMALAVGCYGTYSIGHPASGFATTQTHSQEQAMTTAASSLTAEEIGHRVLKLIDSIHTADDISPTHIEKVMGVKVQFNEKDPNDYGFGGKLTDEWSYDFGSLNDSPGEKPTRLMLSFEDQTHKNADVTPICKLDYDAYSKFLTDSGFKKSTNYAEHGRILSFTFTREPVSVEISTTGDSKRVCVSMLTIDVMATESVHP